MAPASTHVTPDRTDPHRHRLAAHADVQGPTVLRSDPRRIRAVIPSAEVQTLQRAIGNRATVNLLRPHAAPAARGRGSGPASGPRQPATEMTVQRAIGFEFEFGTWKTAHEDNSMLAKGEEVINGKGYKVEGEDAGTDVSAIEVVTVPFATKQEAITSVDEAQKTFESMFGKAPPVKASDYPGGKDGVVVTPRPGLGKMQASPAVSLDKIGDLYRAGTGKGYADAVTTFLRSKETKKKYLGKNAPSDDLIGLVMLIVSYMEQGSRKQALFYPKSAFTIMARTSFDKMVELLPEHGFFSDPKNKTRWVELNLATARRVIPSMRQEQVGWKTDLRGRTKRDKGGLAIPKTRKRSMDEIAGEEVLGMPLMGVETLPEDVGKGVKGYKLKTTREEWLAGMLEGEDKLSKAEDSRFEGMGAYGGAMDVEQLKTVAEEGTTRALGESGVKERVRVEKEQDSTPKDTPLPTGKRAPLFELRGLRDMFAIDQDITLTNWTAKVAEVFDIIDKVNQRSFAPGGKPTVPGDVDNPGIWEKL